MLKNEKMKNKELDLKGMIKAVRNMAEIKQRMFEYGIYDVEGNDKNSGAHIQKILLEHIADESKEKISFHSRNCDTYPYEGRISIENVKLFALYTIDELISYAERKRN